MLLGYARVSTDDQNLDLQRDALAKAGCERVFEDMASGGKTERTGLAALLASLRVCTSRCACWKRRRQTN